MTPASVLDVSEARLQRAVVRPRIGFAGVGWIGRRAMASVLQDAVAEVAAVADPSPEQRHAAHVIAPGATLEHDFESLLDLDLDAVVIATPSALHADQCVAALERGLAVFCQKPLGCDAEETARVVDAAQFAGRLLAVDFCYRQTKAIRAVRSLIDANAIGSVYAAELTFHNAYGPDKPWRYNRALAGGGCLMDLGIHLVDLALWILGFPHLTGLQAQLYTKGRLLSVNDRVVEDHAMGQLQFGDKTVQIGCSWNLSAGRDAVIRASFYGTSGAAVMRNVGGSFYDFVAEYYQGARAEVLASPPDAWGGRAITAWARRLAAGFGYDPEVEHTIEVARILDAMDGAGRCGA